MQRQRLRREGKLVLTAAGKCKTLLVGAAGFEPATPCSQNRCATRLRHAPTFPIVASKGS